MSIKTLLHEHFNQYSISRNWPSHNFTIGDNKLKKPFVKSQNIEIKKFNMKDLKKCSELYLKVFSSYPWFDGWISTVQVKDYLMELISNPVFEGFIVCEGLKIVAVCFGHRKSRWMGKEFYIDEFFVALESQGNGVGTLLIEYIMEYLYQEEYKRLILLTNKGIPAEEFYLKNGFKTDFDRINMVKEF